MEKGHAGSAGADGKTLFFRQWQAGKPPGGGLGPLYNAKSCAACHVKLGRGRAPTTGSADPSFLLQLSVPPANEAERKALAFGNKPFLPEPQYGGQLQTKAVAGYQAEGRVSVTYFARPYQLDDGTMVILQRPVYSATDIASKPLNRNIALSPRIAQPITGMGRIDAISDREILANEDPHDRDGDGISGRANRVRNIRTGTMVVGRFGWKASEPNLVQQVAAAFAQDIGISSQLFAEAGKGCLDTSSPCRNGGSKSGGGAKSEISIWDIVRVADYLRLQEHSMSPASRESQTVGSRLFTETGCASCHRPSLRAIIKSDRNNMKLSLPVNLYSDLLLHDMGAALADHRPVADASGWEWRTQPLWGLGRAGVKGNKSLLHDGRARTITEAILWHGGEAKTARMKFAALDKADRQRLLGFLQGL